MHLSAVVVLCLVIASSCVAGRKVPKRCRQVTCAENEHCEVRTQTLQCFVAPCPTKRVAECVPNDTPTDSSPSCAATLCPAGTECQEQQVQCFVAPCPPIVQCV